MKRDDSCNQIMKDFQLSPIKMGTAMGGFDSIFSKILKFYTKPLMHRSRSQKNKKKLVSADVPKSNITRYSSSHEKLHSKKDNHYASISRRFLTRCAIVAMLAHQQDKHIRRQSLSNKSTMQRLVELMFCEYDNSQIKFCCLKCLLCVILEYINEINDPDNKIDKILKCRKLLLRMIHILHEAKKELNLLDRKRSIYGQTRDCKRTLKTR